MSRNVAQSAVAATRVVHGAGCTVQGTGYRAQWLRPGWKGSRVGHAMLFDQKRISSPEGEGEGEGDYHHRRVRSPRTHLSLSPGGYT